MPNKRSDVEYSSSFVLFFFFFTIYVVKNIIGINYENYIFVSKTEYYAQYKLLSIYFMGLSGLKIGAAGLLVVRVRRRLPLNRFLLVWFFLNLNKRTHCRWLAKLNNPYILKNDVVASSVVVCAFVLDYAACVVLC